MNRQPVTLIFDIGKTTKKLLVFDKDFHVLEEQTQTFAELLDDDGFPSEDLQALKHWSEKIIQHYLHHQKFYVTHVNFAAYGASLVHLKADGEPLHPFYNYLKAFPEDTKENFLALYNRKQDISTQTCSPFLGLLNSGLQLFWLKHKKPKIFNSIHTTLHFPQYFTYLLTGRKFSDITSIGCHTMLWNFDKQGYHNWVDQEKIGKLFPPHHHADHTVAHVLGDTTVKVGIGVHDSSAALMPYLVVMKEKFLLLSTGTWNICFNPFNQESLSPAELSQDCLCFLTFEGKPVKASRIFLGHEHELQQQAMASFFNVDAEYYKTIGFHADLYKKLKADNAIPGFQPLGMTGTGPALELQREPTNYSTFNNFEEAQHQLIRQLVQWQKTSIDLIDPQHLVKNIIVVGGFTKSRLFLEIMKVELPERNILISDHPRASALGAAWLVCGENAYRGREHLINVAPA